ncbi:MAG: helix-turn-helix transcriptional regulator [Planctomycetota bacterium]
MKNKAVLDKDNINRPAMFGVILRKVRDSRGLSQVQLAKMIGITQRMLSYYENHTHKAPAFHLTKFADALQVSTDVLLGHKSFRDPHTKHNARLWGKLRLVESLPPKDRLAIVRVIDALVEKDEFR